MQKENKVVGTAGKVKKGACFGGIRNVSPATEQRYSPLKPISQTWMSQLPTPHHTGRITHT